MRRGRPSIKRFKEENWIDERIVTVVEKYCSQFGCGRELSRIENLAGDKCTFHMIRKTFIFHNGKL